MKKIIMLIALMLVCSGCVPAYTQKVNTSPVVYSQWHINTRSGTAELQKITVFPSGRIYVHRNWVREVRKVR
jgi:PBP1b-binding outer membrane lipoprotein LpoB